MARKRAQNSLGWLQKYYFPVLNKVQLHIYFVTYTILRKYQTMNNVFWDHSWAEVDRRLCSFMLDYKHYFLLFSITQTSEWLLLLVYCSVKVIQPPCYNSYYKGAYSALDKQLCWELGVSTIVFALLQPTLDVCLTCCRTILYLINHTF